MPKTAENFRQLCLKGPGDGYRGVAKGAIYGGSNLEPNPQGFDDRTSGMYTFF